MAASSNNELRLVAETRTEFGKGAARRIRRADKIPAVLYGHGEAPTHLTLPFHDTFQALKHVNALLTIELDGQDQLALAKDVQRDPLKPIIEHIDLVIVRKGEKVTVDIPVHVEGEAGPETVITVENQTLSVEADATDIPESLTVSVEGLEAGSQILAKDVTLPAGSTLIADEELLVINITQQVSQEELDAELEEAEAEAGIEKDESDEAAEGGDDAAEGSEDKADDEG
ncbi:50S ribosomal protein L25/general stress protein Ctc [Luteipulveratus halotolerans]|uniref:Large ribosomal subunit protein bL25 n=1 Tax=Luteipulveratus halotolerans TaxID=1631356 RepID=A0A0L6CK76_9MICO|nr:50S ribosomal protein L25/general stress protein Ctc [Luteipulveratus halotolerans]KNX38010.1 50S ribosomal protein L25 [Luteipulveratus halotolerans]